MTKSYELPNERMLVADYDEKNMICHVAVQTLDSLIRDLNYYADKCEEYESGGKERVNEYE